MHREARARRIRDEIWPEDAGPQRLRVYAILDGARREQIRPMVVRSGRPYCALYSGAPPVLEAAGPQLVQLDREAPLTETLLHEGWGDAWGVLVGANATLEEVRRHLKRLLVVQDEAGKKLAFRFYDPRVLRVYLPVCNAGELRSVFGPASFFWAEGEEGASLIRYHREGERLGQREIALGE